MSQGAPPRVTKLQQNPFDPRHGTINGYSNCSCHCERCKKAWRDFCEAKRQERKERLAADPSVVVHGSRSTYTNWGCKCEKCRNAHAVYKSYRRKLTENSVDHPVG